MKPKWTLKVCWWEPHLCQDFGAKILGWCYWHSEAIQDDLDSRISLGSRVYNWNNITIEGHCCPHGGCWGTQLRSVWGQLPENWLQENAIGSHCNDLIMSISSQWNMNIFTTGKFWSVQQVGPLQPTCAKSRSTKLYFDANSFTS